VRFSRRLVSGVESSRRSPSRPAVTSAPRADLGICKLSHGCPGPVCLTERASFPTPAGMPQRADLGYLTRCARLAVELENMQRKMRLDNRNLGSSFAEPFS
jgi:hypothetical protein